MTQKTPQTRPAPKKAKKADPAPKTEGGRYGYGWE